MHEPYTGNYSGNNVLAIYILNVGYNLLPFPDILRKEQNWALSFFSSFLHHIWDSVRCLFARRIFPAFFRSLRPCASPKSAVGEGDLILFRLLLTFALTPKIVSHNYTLEARSSNLIPSPAGIKVQTRQPVIFSSQEGGRPGWRIFSVLRLAMPSFLIRSPLLISISE